jgi:subtilisin family serine protease
VYGRGDLQGNVNIWLPSGDFISKNTYFLNANPYTTVTSPGNSIVPITLTAYNSNNNGLYMEAGKGFSTSNIINPDLAAPGVNIQCPALDHTFTTLTGTSAAAAHTAGIAAMILEWSIVRNNYPDIDTVGIKKFLIRGANRSSQRQYPNREWGYGSIDLFNSFNLLRTDVENALENI